MRRLIVKKLQYQGVPLQDLLHDAALHSCTAAMDESNLVETGGVSLVQILFDHRRDVARGKGVKVDDAFDRDPERVLILHSQAVAGLS